MESRHTQTKPGVSGGHHGAGDDPFIFLLPCGVTHARRKPALPGQSHTWEVWYKTPEDSTTFWHRHSLTFSPRNLPLRCAQGHLSSPGGTEFPGARLCFFCFTTLALRLTWTKPKPSQGGGKGQARFSGDLRLPACGRRGGARRPRGPALPALGRGRSGAAMVPSPGRNPKSGAWPGFREVGEPARACPRCHSARRAGNRAARARGGGWSCGGAPGTSRPRGTSWGLAVLEPAACGASGAHGRSQPGRVPR